MAPLPVLYERCGQMEYMEGVMNKGGGCNNSLR